MCFYSGQIFGITIISLTNKITQIVVISEVRNGKSGTFNPKYKQIRKSIAKQLREQIFSSYR